MARIRLDDWLVREKHYPTRARARDAITRGCVSLSSGLIAKPSRTIAENESVRIDDPAQTYVSRAALKLIHALDATGISPSGRIALDLGASTGGFCQVLLERGAERVFAVDVGHGQMDPKLVSDPRLRNIEGLNARDLTLHHLDGERPDFLTSDLSFISLKLALPAALNLAKDGAIGIFLVKPQFEVGKQSLGKGGIVRKPEDAELCAKELRDWLSAQKDWQATHLMPSPISGGDGNQEFLLIGRKHA